MISSRLASGGAATPRTDLHQLLRRRVVVVILLAVGTLRLWQIDLLALAELGTGATTHSTPRRAIVWAEVGRDATEGRALIVVGRGAANGESSAAGTTSDNAPAVIHAVRHARLALSLVAVGAGSAGMFRFR